MNVDWILSILGKAGEWLRDNGYPRATQAVIKAMAELQAEHKEKGIDYDVHTWS